MNRILLNCDMGEGFGAWRMGDDALAIKGSGRREIKTDVDGNDLHPSFKRKVPWLWSGWR